MMEGGLLLNSWSAWSNSKTKRSMWIDWAKGVTFIADPECLPDVSMVPAMQRRRMSTLSKMAFSTALECLKGVQVTPNCVFASQHGELTRTVKIIDSIALERDVSPTDFSLSVHNTALGLFSIFTGNKQPSTMVVGGADTFGYALLEAQIYLSRFPGSTVLLVYFDEPLPGLLSLFEEEQAESFSVALLLSTSNKPNISVSYSHNASEKSDGLNLGLAFLKFYLSGKACAEVNSATSTWKWRRFFQ